MSVLRKIYKINYNPVVVSFTLQNMEFLMCVCICMCLYVQVHVYAHGGQGWILNGFPNHSPTLFGETTSLTDLYLTHWVGYTDGHWYMRDLLSLPHQHWDYTHVSLQLAFSLGSGDQPQVLMLAQWAIKDWTISSVPKFKAQMWQALCYFCHMGLHSVVS